MASPTPAANGTTKTPQVVNVFSKAEVDEIGVETLVGEYVESGMNHERKVFKRKRREGDDGLVVLLYFWDQRDGEEFSGWWFGDRVGGAHVWSRCATNAMMPPSDGWCIPWDGDVVETLGVAVQAPTPAPAPAATVAKKTIVKQEILTKKEIPAPEDNKPSAEDEGRIQRSSDRVIIAEIEASQAAEKPADSSEETRAAPSGTKGKAKVPKGKDKEPQSETTEAPAEAKEATGCSALTTDLNYTAFAHGIYFKIVLESALTITAFRYNLLRAGTLRVWTRPGTYGTSVGSGWVLAMTPAWQQAGNNIVMGSLQLSAGSHMILLSSSGNVGYKLGASVGMVHASNADLGIYSGYGTCDFTPGSSDGYAIWPRNFAGTIEYCRSTVSQASASSTRLLKLEPDSTLKFNSCQNESGSYATLKLTNVSADNVAFKVKTTAPKLYIVRPYSGLLLLGESQDVQLIHQQQGADDSAVCSHCFLIQAVQTSSAEALTRDQWVELPKDKIDEAILKAELGVQVKIEQEHVEGSTASEQPTAFENRGDKETSICDSSSHIRRVRKKWPRNVIVIEDGDQNTSVGGVTLSENHTRSDIKTETGLREAGMVTKNARQRMKYAEAKRRQKQISAKRAVAGRKGGQAPRIQKRSGDLTRGKFNIGMHQKQKKMANLQVFKNLEASEQDLQVKQQQFRKEIGAKLPAERVWNMYSEYVAMERGETRKMKKEKD